MTLAISHAINAEPLAALLPVRRREPWTVGPAPYGIRANAAMSRITNGDRSLIVVEQAGIVEVYAERDDFPVYPEIAVNATDPDPVAALAAFVLRSVLPALDHARANATIHAYGWQQVIVDMASELNEVAYSLIDHGAHPEVVQQVAGVAIQWKASSGAVWTLGALSPTGTLDLTYSGPLDGLYGALPVLLPAAEGCAPSDAGRAFTRYLCGRFAQFRPVTDWEVEFGTRKDISGLVSLPNAQASPDEVDDSTHVVASFSRLGADLLLTAVSHLA
ncbi:hypothetical protein ABZ804_21835 [Streptomyces sp. NPDC047726]|uniref:hypothetical protein n=1 Tax=unclassified Streptomyces TaxID=2593676 RepID=UPI00340544FB